jgi:UDP-3-O-[3-hydroxymyristoyl] glucosamine N-acyltransferase
MIRVRDIAAVLRAGVEGDGELELSRVAKIEEAGGGDITFLANLKYLKHLETTAASAVIISRAIEVPARGDGLRPVYLRVDNPYASFLKVLLMFHPPHDPLPPGIHPTAVVDPSAIIGAGVRVGALAVIAEGCQVGDGTVVMQGTVLCAGAVVGPDSLLYPHVTVREGCTLGARVIVHSGTVIGSDGFGFAPLPDGTYEKIPQLGIVRVGDDVEIGANCALDRATMGETRIGNGTKLDNLIQIAHNVVVGENTVIAAQSGISGSTRIGKRNMIGGQVGFVGHLDIGDDCKWGAQSGVTHDTRKSGGTYFGTPAQEFRTAAKITAAQAHLPDALAAIRELRQEVERLQREIALLKEERGRS